jgi:SNF2 family DNA or RNA helicase
MFQDGTIQGELQALLRKNKTQQGNRSNKKEVAPKLDFSKVTGLLGNKWKRVILDEAHCIKNSSTVVSRACCLLQAERHWCVSGTIIQNSLDDVYALFKFLNHQPWCENSFWKAAIGREPDLGVALDRVRRVLNPIMLRRTKESHDKEG